MTIRDMNSGELEQWDSVMADRYIEERRKRTSCASAVRALRNRAELFMPVFFKHWDIGWAVFDPNGEGIESIEPSLEAAEKNRAINYDDDAREEVEIYPIAWARDGDESQKIVRLSVEDAALLARVRELLIDLGRLTGHAAEAP
jgi:hypothetical protein